LIGRELDYHTELLEWFLNQNGNVIKGFSNALYSGITTIRMAKYVKKIIKNFPLLSGIYNVSSTPISKYELLLLFKQAFGINVEILKDDFYSSKKDLISSRFYTDIKEDIPTWEDLIVELNDDSNLNIDFYKK
jgi:dTDP-4-dehydrorhamnose reductase